MTPLKSFEVRTPLGKAICIGVSDDISPIEWVTFIKKTGECWSWQNQYIRLEPSITAGVYGPSPIDTPEGLQKHIERYKIAGWLP